MVFEPKARPTILPIIASNDYDSFRGILRSHIPDAYDEWLDLLRSGRRNGARTALPSGVLM
jgi:hypothetical protein